jgi:hypothetical protein
MIDPTSLPPLPTGPGEPLATAEIVLTGISLFLGVILLIGLALAFS